MNNVQTLESKVLVGMKQLNQESTI